MGKMDHRQAKIVRGLNKTLQVAPTAKKIQTPQIMTFDFSLTASSSRLPT